MVAKGLDSEAARCIEDSPQRPRGATGSSGAAVMKPPAWVRTGRGVVEQTLASWLRESSSGGEDAASSISDAARVRAEFTGRDDVAPHERDLFRPALGDRAGKDSDGGGEHPSQAHARMECAGAPERGRAERGVWHGERGDEGDSILDMVASTVHGGGSDEPRRGEIDDDRRVDTAVRSRCSVVDARKMAALDQLQSWWW
jgi:hypothetical protein